MNIEKEILDLYNKLKYELSSNNYSYDEKILDKAFFYVYELHKKDHFIPKLKYIEHLLGTSIRLVSLNANFLTIVSGLLHHTREKNISDDKIKSDFGKEVYNILIGFKKLTEIEYVDGMSSRDSSFLKSIFKVAGKNIDVFLIKICAKIDLLERGSCTNVESQYVIAKEILDIYLPIIKILGIGKYIGNIEDLCFKFISPDEYSRIENILIEKKDDLDKKIIFLEDKILEECNNKNINVKIEGRIKTIYSIYRKMKYKGLPFSSIYDIIAIRIIVDTKDQTYYVLGLIHSIFHAVNNRIKDYISSPKINGYQSIHTTLMDGDNDFFEVQIQTKDMYKLNTFGLASHVSYKSYTSGKALPKWIKKINKNMKESFDFDELFDKLTLDNSLTPICCYTPKGDKIELPKGSKLLDFAFNIHTDFGKKIIGASINGEYIENLLYTLNTGDVIKLKIGEKENDYPVDYITILKSKIARKNLKLLFKNKSEEKRLKLGEHLINEQIELSGYRKISNMSSIIIQSVLDKFGLTDLNHLYLEVGSGNMNVDKIIDHIYHLKNNNSIYKNQVSLQIELKRKKYKTIHSITDVFHNFDIKIIDLKYKGLYFYAHIHVQDAELLHDLVGELSRLPNVKDVERKFTYRIWIFIIMLIFIFSFILLNPAILFLIDQIYDVSTTVYKSIFYVSISFYVFLLYFFKHIASVTLPGLIRKNFFWLGMFLLNTFILFTVIYESITIFGSKDGVWFFSLVMILFGLLIFEFFEHRKMDK